jgi:hypothetical protein
MNRRSILKTAGIALAGSVLAPFDSLAQSALSKPILEKDTPPNTLLGKRKLVFSSLKEYLEGYLFLKLVLTKRIVPKNQKGLKHSLPKQFLLFLKWIFDS